MAPLQNKNIESLQYTHDKFNCSCSHKNLSRRLIRKNNHIEEEIQGKRKQEAIKSHKPSLFRPYALDSRGSSTIPTTSAVKQQISAFPETLQIPPNCMQYTHNLIPFYALQQIALQSQEQYVYELQRQRAVLLMKHVMQFYEQGNGWPSVHPNAVNNPAFYFNNNY